MDKRQEKSRAKIITTFKALLYREDYEGITASRLIEESGLSRSAFYSNFKGKEDVVRALADSLFEHVSSPNKEKEKGHDFSASSPFDCEALLIHLASHFSEEQVLFARIFDTGASPVYEDETKRNLVPVMEALVRSGNISKEGIPERLLVLQLTSGYVALLRHWIEGGCRYSAGEITAVFFKLYR